MVKIKVPVKRFTKVNNRVTLNINKIIFYEPGHYNPDLVIDAMKKELTRIIQTEAFFIPSSPDRTSNNIITIDCGKIKSKSDSKSLGINLANSIYIGWNNTVTR